MMMELLHFFLTGLWDLIWHFGILIGLMILSVLVMWFTPFKKLGFLGLILIGGVLIGYTVGVIDERHLWVASQARLSYLEDKARDNAVKSIAAAPDKPGVRNNDKYNRDKR
jgi:hypothetical protein